MVEVLRNPVFLIWTAITLIVVVPTIAHFWWKIRQAEIEASLKHEMLQRGMSAEEIQTVLGASGTDVRKKADQVSG